MGTVWAIGAALTLVSCGSGEQAAVTSTDTTTTATTSAALAVSPPANALRTKNWFDLDVGDCLVDLPRVDLGDVQVDVVDCARPHAGEVFLRAPVEVNEAIADVADRQCAAGVAEYTGRPADGIFTVTYLIDSNQDRTTDNPLPSTVLCLLQAGNGQPLSSSARRP
jgi:hypothetical protein